MIVKAGSTNVSVYYYIVQDASGTSPGEPVTGLLFSNIETGGSASYARQGAARVDLTLITLASASAAHSDGGFILVDDTNMPGLYRCDYPDAAFATGVDQVFLSIVVAAANNAVAAPILVDISDNVDQTGDSYALANGSAGFIAIDTVVDAIKVKTDFLPSATAGNAGGVFIAGTNAATAVTTSFTSTFTGNLTGSVASVSGAVGSVTGAVGSVTGGATAAELAKVPKSDGVVTWNATALASVNAECDTAITDAALATAAAMATAQADLDIITGVSGVNLLTATQASIDAIEADTANMQPKLGTPAADISADIAAAKAVVDALPTLTEILTTQMTEAYAADGVAPTLTQAIMLIQQAVTEFAIAGTTITVKKIDKSTTAATYTLDDGTNPTSRTRAT